MSPTTSSEAVPGLHTSSLTSLPLVYRGKVRDVYEIDAAHWLIIATDRVSAFDVILPNVIPGKGQLLTELALYWFEQFRAMIPNHLASLRLEEVLPDPAEYAQAKGRSMVVRRLKPLPVEAVVRGYLAGSGWKDYQLNGRISGLELPAGLRQAEQFDQPLFTPSTKAAAGEHDESISFEEVEALVGRQRAEDIRRVSLALYRAANQHAARCGIIIADTKFEFGTDASGNLTLMDEILTPDSSRFWEASTWTLDTSPASFDKQFVRDWLETLDWDKTAPGPTLPENIMSGTLARYREAVARLTESPVGG